MEDHVHVESCSNLASKYVFVCVCVSLVLPSSPHMLFTLSKQHAGSLLFLHRPYLFNDVTILKGGLVSGDCALMEHPHINTV